MMDFSVTKDQQTLYYDKLYSYTDSLVDAEKIGTDSYVFAMANHLMLQKEYKKSFMLLHSNYLKRIVTKGIFRSMLILWH